MTMHRRLFLKSGGLSLFAASAGVVPAFLQRSAFAASASGRQKTLVVVFQRFGMDGLMAVSPLGDARLAILRPDFMLSAPGSGRDDARLALDGTYGLHPGFAALAPLYAGGELAIVHAAGSPDTTRSHSLAQLNWESGAPGDRGVSDGFLNRALSAATPPQDDAGLRAVALSVERPRIFYGAAPVAAVSSVDGLLLQTPADLDSQALQADLANLYQQHGHDALRNAGLNSLELSQLLREAGSAKAAPASAYPAASPFAVNLREIARLIKARVGLQIAFADCSTTADGKGTWDSHANQAALNGPFDAMARDFSASVAAFWNDLGALREDVTLLTLTDFGRNVVQNAGVGTDHGRATAMFVLGTDLQGGKVYGSLPERFERDALEDGLDLPVTTDFRSVLAPLLKSQLHIADMATVFPGWQGPDLSLLRV